MAQSPVKTSSTFTRDIDFCGKEMLGDRADQEDYSLFRTLSGSTDLLAILSDGMGGHAAGEVASRSAVMAFDKTFVDYPSSSIPGKLGAALQQANAELSKLIKATPSLNGMGCTLLGVYVSRAGLHWVSVGDSLLLLFRGGKIFRLNADHSMAPVIEESLRQGKLTKQEAAAHPNRNALRSAVMGEDLSLIDLPEKPFNLFRGDIIIVASDGLLTLSDSQMVDYINKYQSASADLIAKALIQAVDQKNKPKQDNTTVQVIIVPSFIGKPKAFSIKGFLIAFILFLSCCLSAAYFLDTPNKILRKIWPSVFEPDSKPTPVPISASTAPTSQQDQGSATLPPALDPSGPGLGVKPSIKIEPEAPKKPKIDKHEAPPAKTTGGKPKVEPDSKSGKPKDVKAPPVDNGDTTGDSRAAPVKVDPEIKGVSKYFDTPPSAPPSNKTPQAEAIKLDI